MRSIVKDAFRRKHDVFHRPADKRDTSHTLADMTQLTFPAASHYNRFVERRGAQFPENGAASFFVPMAQICLLFAGIIP